MTITIASRQSRLALWQAEYVRARLLELLPSTSVDILGMTTRGDQILDRSLAKVGGKGLFVKELEQALLEKRADLAVHSLKDVPMELAPDFSLDVVLQRESPFDALVSNHYANFQAMPAGARVGTSSLRRSAQLCARYPTLQFVPVRGNLDTRLAKLDAGEFDALVLACAGLHRLGLSARVRAVLAPEESLPAAGQGALAVETRRESSLNKQPWYEALLLLHDAETHACVSAERAVLRHLGGNCETPIAAYAERQGGELFLRALVASHDGTVILRCEERQQAEDFCSAEQLGARVAEKLLDQGADRLLLR